MAIAKLICSTFQKKVGIIAPKAIKPDKNAMNSLRNFISVNEKLGNYTELSFPSINNYYEFSLYAKNSKARVFDIQKSKTTQVIKQILSWVNTASHKRHLRNIKNGNYNSLPLDFKPANSVEEAILFGKNNKLYKHISGIESELDLETLNVLNKSLIDVHNKTHGKSIMPNIVLLKNNLKSKDGLESNASYSNICDILKINRAHSLRPTTIYHEMGHANHALNTDLCQMRRIEEIKKYGGSTNITQNFLDDQKLQNLIKNNLRDYSASSPAEFVADVFAAKMQGKVLPEDIELAYKALKGSNIIPQNFVALW